MKLSVSHLGFSYGSHEVLRDVSFSLEEGKLLCVLGPNGVGKSTLFKCILGLAENYQGNILLDGEELRTLSPKERARRMAYIPQQNHPAFNFTVEDMVLMGTASQFSVLSVPGKRQHAQVEKVLQSLDILSLRNRGYGQLSGGERQLVLFARAIVQGARLLIMDEPTANLDYGNQVRIQRQMKKLTREGYMIVQSIHNPQQAFLFADEVLCMLDGQVYAKGGPKDVVTREVIAKLYGIDVEIQSLKQDRVRICVPVFSDER